MRAKDKAVIDALESGRAEHAEAHSTTVKHYERTIAELQASLAAARAKISDMEAQHAFSIREATNQQKALESNISSDQKSYMDMLSRGLELEVGKTQAARREVQRSHGELDEKARELRASEISNRVAQRELRGQFLEQMQAMRVEINSQHSHELAAERARISGLEERIMNKDARYHALADELRRHEERNRVDRAHLRKAKDRCDRLSLEIGSLAALRDELRARVSELTVKLSSQEGKIRKKEEAVSSKDAELQAVREELQSLHVELDEQHILVKKYRTENMQREPQSPSNTATTSPFKEQLKSTLKESAKLRKEVQMLRLTMAEKDFRIGALREIVGGLEKMVPNRG